MKKIEGKTIAPYSPAIISGRLVFTSGQIAVDEAGNVQGTTIEEQAERAIMNLKAVLEKAGASLESVVKATVFLKSMNDYAKMNAVYERYLTSRPARLCVEAARLPRDALIEIEAVAELEE